MLPFSRALSIYRAAGFRFVELAGYWKGGPWEAAQHLRGIAPADAVKMARDAGLEIATYHDMGGLIDENTPSAVAPDTYRYLDAADIPCVVLHVPHKRGADADWWRAYQKAFLRDAAPLTACAMVCVENMPPLEGCYVPLIDPQDMRAFLAGSGLYANVDTSHCAQSGADPARWAEEFGSLVGAVHLSDFDGAPHRPVGSGRLNLAEFIRHLNPASVQAVTLEAEIPGETDAARIESAKQARARVEKMLAAK